MTFCKAKIVTWSRSTAQRKSVYIFSPATEEALADISVATYIIFVHKLNSPPHFCGGRVQQSGTVARDVAHRPAKRVCNDGNPPIVKPI